RIARPGEWSEEAISTMLAHRVGARSTVVMRLLDVTGTALFQVGATVLVILSPILVAGTAVLSIGVGLSTLVLHRRAPAERSRSPSPDSPIALRLLTLALAVFGVLALCAPPHDLAPPHPHRAGADDDRCPRPRRPPLGPLPRPGRRGGADPGRPLR